MNLWKQALAYSQLHRRPSNGWKVRALDSLRLVGMTHAQRDSLSLDVYF